MNDNPRPRFSFDNFRCNLEAINRSVPVLSYYPLLGPIGIPMAMLDKHPVTGRSRIERFEERYQDTFDFCLNELEAQRLPDVRERISLTR